MKPAAYLDAVKAELNVSSDYELAKRLDCRSNHLAEYRSEKRGIPLDVAFRVAITLQLDPARVVADLEEQSTKNEKRRAFWQGFLQRARHLTVVLALTLASICSVIYGNGAATHGGFFRRLKDA